MYLGLRVYLVVHPRPRIYPEIWRRHMARAGMVLMIILVGIIGWYLDGRNTITPTPTKTPVIIPTAIPTMTPVPATGHFQIELQQQGDLMLVAESNPPTRTLVATTFGLQHTSAFSKMISGPIVLDRGAISGGYPLSFSIVASAHELSIGFLNYGRCPGLPPLLIRKDAEAWQVTAGSGQSELKRFLSTGGNSAENQIRVKEKFAIVEVKSQQGPTIPPCSEISLISAK